MGNSEIKKAKEITLADYIKMPKPQSFLKTVFSDPKKLEVFATSTIIAVSTNPDLAKCTPQSLLNCALQIENLGLSLSTQDCYIAPFNKKDKNGNVVAVLATLVIGYKGLVRLAQRSGLFKNLIVSEVKESEFVSWDRFTEVFIYNAINDDERECEKTVGYFANFVTTSGFQKKMYWTIGKMERYADTFSKAFSLKMYRKLQEGKIPKDELWKYSSFWYKHFDEMALKTMIRQMLSKWGDLTPMLRTALACDGATIEDDGKGNLKPVYIDTTAEDVDPTAEAEPTPEPAQIPDMPEQTEEPEDIGLDDL